MLQSYYQPCCFYQALFVKQTNNCTQSQVTRYTTFFSGWHMYLGSALSALRWEQRHTFIFRMSLSCKNPSFYLLIQNIFTTHKSYLQTMLAINSDDRTSKQYKYWSFFHSGSRSAPQQSIMTKCVPPEHLGKVRKSFSMYYFIIPPLPFQIFSIFGAISTLLGMAMSYLNTMVPFLAKSPIHSSAKCRPLQLSNFAKFFPGRPLSQNPFLPSCTIWHSRAFLGPPTAWQLDLMRSIWFTLPLFHHPCHLLSWWHLTWYPLPSDWQ